MAWKKLGFLIKPDKKLWWMQTHAMIPTVEYLDDGLVKVYFSGRNKDNQSHIGYVIVKLNAPTKVIEVSESPILSPGKLGCFDDNGVTPSCIINTKHETLLYYIGWNPGSTTRMHIYGGLAISTDDGKTFKRYSQAPIIERNRVNPYINTAPFVLNDDNRWLMYYVSGTQWVHRDLPRYNIQIATSSNGKEWCRKGVVAIDYINDENALARPFVIKENGKYKMWFASKGTSLPNYRMQYAESNDGTTWTRIPSYENITPTPNGPDGEMIEYAAIAQWEGKKIMFYNGNNYGAEGILVAEEQ